MESDAASQDDWTHLSADAAIPELIRAHGGRLWAVSSRFCGNADEADDLVQEVFLQAWRKWDTFEGRSNPATWLFTIASRACQRMHRKRAGEPGKLKSLEDPTPFRGDRGSSLPDPAEGPVDKAVRQESRAYIETAIVDLPVAFRLPVVLKEIVGLSISDVAKMLGIKEGTVKTRLHRARLRLREALENALPPRPIPPTEYDKRVCLDLLTAKQDALDRGADFAFAPGVFCERCAAVFRELDLAQDLCRELGDVQLPARVRARILAALGDSKRA